MINKITPHIKTRKFISGGFLILVFAVLFTVSDVVSGQELTATPSPIPTITEQQETDTDLDLKALKEAALKKMSEYPELVRKGYKPFEFGSAKIRDGWALLNVFSVDANPPEKFDLIDSVSYLALAQKKEDGSWDVYLETEKEFSEKKKETPDTVISAEGKKGLLSKYETDLLGGDELTLTRTEDEYHVPGLPYAAGSAWLYTCGPNEGYHTGTALDFAVPGGSSGTVTAAEDGEVTAIGDTCLKIRRYNSNFELLYQHIQHNKQIGNDLDLGNSVGTTVTTSGTGMCAGSSSGHHVHIQMVGVNLAGKSFNGWVVNNQDLVKEGTTVNSDGDQVSHGDWVIAKGSDYIVSFPGEAQIPRNVIVKNDSVLQLGSGARVNIDFVNYKLEVQSGSGVLVKSGGGI